MSQLLICDLANVTLGCSDPVSFDHYLVVILDAENAKSEEVFVEKANTSQNNWKSLKFFHHYLIYLFSVAERGNSKLL